MRKNKFTEDELSIIKTAVRQKLEAYQKIYKRDCKEMSKQTKQYLIRYMVTCENILRKLEKTRG